MLHKVLSFSINNKLSAFFVILIFAVLFMYPIKDSQYNKKINEVKVVAFRIEDHFNITNNFNNKTIDDYKSITLSQESSNNIKNAYTNDNPKVSLLVKNLGLNKIGTVSALELDANVTLGFSPYSNDLKQWIEQANSEGHEVFLHLPIQSDLNSSEDLGVLALSNNSTIENNLSKLKNIISKSDKIEGLYLDIREDIMSSLTDIESIMKSIKASNLNFLCESSNNSALEAIANKVALKYSNVAIDIDNELNEEEAISNLLRLENLVKVRGHAVAVLNAYPMSIKLISEWINSLPSKKIDLVPITELFVFKNNISNRKKTEITNNLNTIEDNDDKLKDIKSIQLLSKDDFIKYIRHDNLIDSSEVDNSINREGDEKNISQFDENQ